MATSTSDMTMYEAREAILHQKGGARDAKMARWFLDAGDLENASRFQSLAAAQYRMAREAMGAA